MVFGFGAGKGILLWPFQEQLYKTKILYCRDLWHLQSHRYRSLLRHLISTQFTWRGLVLNTSTLLSEKLQSLLRRWCVCWVPKCYFTYVKRKLAPGPHELNSWQGQLWSLPLRRLDSQETSQAVANIHKFKKSLCVCKYPHIRILWLLPVGSAWGSIVTWVIWSLNGSAVHIKYLANNKHTLVREMGNWEWLFLFKSELVHCNRLPY